MEKQTQKEHVVEGEAQVAAFQTGQDVKTAVLIVSVVANVAIFVLWLTLQLTSRFDIAMSQWLFG